MAAACCIKRKATTTFPAMEETTRVVSTDTTDTAKITAKRWLCDVCKLASFPDFDEACRHEEQCAIEHQRQLQQQTSSAAKQQEQTPPPEVSPAASAQDLMEMETQLIQQQQRQNAAKKAAAFQQKKKASSSSSSSNNKSTHSFFAPRAAKKQRTNVKKPAASSSKKKANDNTHSFFVPRSSSSSSTLSSCNTSKEPAAVAAPPTEKAIDVDVDMDVDAAKKPPPPATPKSREARSTMAKSQPDSDSSDSAVVVEKVVVVLDDDNNNNGTGTKTNNNKKPRRRMTVEEAMVTANSLAAKVDQAAEPPKVAAVFLADKQLLAEQRQVEFQAKRRLQRQKEQERQHKRNQQKAAAAVKLTAPSRPVPPQTMTQPARPPANSRWQRGLRFPTPNHVIPKEQPSLKVSPERRSHRWIDIHSKKPMATDSSMDLQEDGPSCRRLVASPGALDSMEDTSSDHLFEIFSDLLIPPPQHTAKTTSGDTRLFTEKYRMGPNGFVGESAQKTARSMRKWIQEWQTNRQGALDRMAERQRKLAKRRKQKVRKNVYKNDDEFMDEEDMLRNLCLISGPPASGKTSLVHEVARECGCKVLEINSTEARGGQSLKNAILEATQSCSSLDLLQKQKPNENPNPWSASTKPLEDSDNEGGDNNDNNSKSSSSLTIILIDEVDILFESDGDAGFWSALQFLSRTAKSPIFLTANSVPTPLKTMPHISLKTQRPSPEECMQKLLQVCKEEQITIRNNDDNDLGSKFEWMAQMCRCDLRHLLMELQYFSHGRGGTATKRPPKKIVAAPKIKANDASTDTKRPTLVSLEPATVPVDKYSIVTFKGKHLNNLVAPGTATEKEADTNISIHIGSLQCQFRLIDDETVLVLCPPCPSHEPCREDRVASVGISAEKSPFGRLHLDGLSVNRNRLLEGCTLTSCHRLLLTYHFEEDEIAMAEENEFEGDSKQPQFKKQSLDEGMKVWEEALSKIESSERVETMTATPTPEDIKLQSTLEAFAEDALLHSDAAYLEDLQDGLPSLSGACRGFAFDMTEGGGDDRSDSGKLRMYEKSRPPREERLYELGWKENNYFYGNANSYMTMPTTAIERKQIRSDCVQFRGTECFGIEAMAPEKDEADSTIDDYIPRTRASEEEDMYLPVAIPGRLETLPSLLRASIRSDRTPVRHEVVQIGKWRALEQLQQLVWNLFPRNPRPPKAAVRILSAESLLKDVGMTSVLIHDYLPMLRTIGLLERIAERTESESDPATMGRMTRTQAAARRRHYYDRFSGRLERDEGSMSSTEVGGKMADCLLDYCHDTTATTHFHMAI